MPGWLPVALNLAGRRCVVVGGGQVAERRALALADAGATVEVVALDATDRLRALSTDGRLLLREQQYEPGILSGAFLVVVATNNRSVNEAARAEASRERALVNDATSGDSGDVVVASSVCRGDLLISVTTLGASPSLSAAICNRLEREIGPEYATLTSILREARTLAASTGAPAPARHKLLAELASDGTLLDMIRAGQAKEARTKALSCISLLSD